MEKSISQDSAASCADKPAPSRIRAALDKASVGLSVRKVGMTPGCGWKISGGCLVHESGGFFAVAGCRFSRGPLRSGVLLYQPQSAIAGLLGRAGPAGPEFLLQARVEPGLVGGAQLAPTIQTTVANYMRLHGGKPTPFIEYFTNH